MTLFRTKTSIVHRGAPLCICASSKSEWNDDESIHFLFGNDIDEENVRLTSDRGKLIQRGGRGSQSSSLFNQDALPPSPPLCSTELHRSIGFYLNVSEFTSIHICTTAFDTQATYFCRAVLSSQGCRILIFALFELHPVREVGENEIGRHECNRGGCKQSRPGLFGS